ncbi:acyclic terpene utilization AtuA family protein [Yinghuangia sp. YIM S09857]|uniref:acyclic terpene utilization AtuA family protein n=1 Tax=Yinghuangia sp. YIM S09857 TaxID=3436929 RepID=UPI003F53DDEF
MTDDRTTTPRRPVRIANCSGFYGDRVAAAREVVEGGPIDVLTGDYLAELTMLILWKARRKDPRAGYAKTFLTQMEQVLGTCLDRGVRIVSNAGGLNPRGLAADLAALAERLGLAPRIACVEGDDLVGRIPELHAAGDLHGLGGGKIDRGLDDIVTANAYLGGWAITRALDAGADIVVCPRTTDAALVSGPAAWWHGWPREAFDALAGAVAAGHVIECGPQATGGNYPFLDELPDHRRPGFPIAEIAADGTSVITKHPGDGGVVNTGTVTAQLLYEVGPPQYQGPDVIADFGSLTLRQLDPDRVEISGARGTAPGGRLKVALNAEGGFRNTMTLAITGLDIDAKARHAMAMLHESLRAADATADVRLLRFDRPDAACQEQATAHLRITVKHHDRAAVDRRFSAAVTELLTSSFSGAYTTTPPTAASAYGIYRPALVQADEVHPAVVLPDGTREVIAHTPAGGAPPAPPHQPHASTPHSAHAATPPAEPHRVLPLGILCGARSGDKGGDANVGVWARDPAAYPWLRAFLTVERFRELVPETRDLVVHRFEFANLHAVNFVVTGLLGDGVASTTRPDAQAKGLAEFVRSRHVPVPEALVPKPEPSGR